VQIVVDTNVFINAIGKISPYRWIFDKIISGEFTLCITNDIFYEYWEVLEEKTTPEIADNIANFLVTIPSVKFIKPFIYWNLILTDEDDNKFVDCAISAGAECIITQDAHFNILKRTSFPSLKVFTPEEFVRIYSL
jgi:putative PIN family toxin of toxin-antitoxin system